MRIKISSICVTMLFGLHLATHAMFVDPQTQFTYLLSKVDSRLNESSKLSAISLDDILNIQFFFLKIVYHVVHQANLITIIRSKNVEFKFIENESVKLIKSRIKELLEGMPYPTRDSYWGMLHADFNCWVINEGNEKRLIQNVGSIIHKLWKFLGVHYEDKSFIDECIRKEIMLHIE